MLVAVQVCRPLGVVFDSVDEDQALGVEVKLALEPGLALAQDIRAVLLTRVPDLFCA